jgi:hypothetical protein
LDFGSTTLNWIRVTHAETELSSTHDTTTTRRSAVGNAWAGWGARCDTRIFSPLDVSSPVSHPMCDVPFPPRRCGEYRKGMIPARTLYQGVRGSVWDPEPSRERVCDWGGPETVSVLLCVAEKRATRPKGERGYSTRRHMLGPDRPEAVSPGRAVVLTDIHSFIDCQ